MSTPVAPSLRAALDELADRVRGLGFQLPAPEALERRRRRDAFVRFIDDYLDARLADPECPLIVGVFGPTGSGKSTLVNSLAGRVISVAGTIRPTTRLPIIWCHPDNSGRYRDRSYDGVEPQVVTEDHPFLRLLTIIDTPDVDSYKAEHRDQAEAVLAECDAAIYVTTPQRYADQVPWQVLASVSKRNMPVVIIVNRLTRRSTGAIADLASMLRSLGIRKRATTRQVLQIQEQYLKDGRIPRAALKPVFNRLQELAQGPEAMRSRTMKGGLAWVVSEVGALVVELEGQATSGTALLLALDGAVAHLVGDFAAQLNRGALVQPEVVARWRRTMNVEGTEADLVSDGVNHLTSADFEMVLTEIRRELEEVMVDRAKRVVAAVREAWEKDPTGRLVLESVPWSDETVIRTEAVRLVDAWVLGLADLIESASAGKSRMRRGVKLGIDSAVTLIALAALSPPLKPSGGKKGTADAMRVTLDQALSAPVAAELIPAGKTKLVTLVEDLVRFRLRGHETAVDPLLDGPQTVADLLRARDVVIKEARRYG